MAINIHSLVKKTSDKPPRLLIYGPPGIGKTTLATEFPDPIFLQTEDGIPGGAEIVTFGHLKSYQDVIDALATIYTESLPFKTIVLDSVSAFQHLLFAHVCEVGDENGAKKRSIEGFGYGKGYVLAQREMAEFLRTLDILRTERGMSIVLIAHSKIDRFDDPETSSYDRYEIDVHDKVRGVVEQAMDGLILLKQRAEIEVEKGGFDAKRAIGKGGAQIWLHANPKAAYVAKNRFGIPDGLYTKGNGFAMLQPYLPKVPATQFSEPEQD